MTRSWAMVVLCAAMLVSARLQGHHNFADIYLEADTIDIEGEVVELVQNRTRGFTAGQDESGAPKIY